MHTHIRLDIVPVSVLVDDKPLPGEWKAWHCFDCGQEGVAPAAPDTTNPAVEIRFSREGVLTAWREGRPAS